MNKLVIALGIFFSVAVKAQTLFDNYKKYEPGSSSCQLFNAVNLELHANSGFTQAQRNEQVNFNLSTQEATQNYISSFNTSLDKTKQKLNKDEFLWRTKTEIGKYGLSVLANYAEALPTKHLTNFIMPGIQQGYDLYVERETNLMTEGHRAEVDDLIKSRIDLLYSNGVDVTKATDEKAFNSMFALAHADIPALNHEDYGVFSKELTKRAYDFIAKNREQIKLVDLKTSEKFEDMKKDLALKTETLQKQITEDTNKKMQAVGNSISNLIQNQEQVFATLNGIQKRVDDNEQQLRLIEKQMYDVRDNLQQLKAKQQEHSKLLAKNSFQIDILSKYTFDGLNTTQKLNALEKGHFNTIFSESERKQLKEELTEIQTKETIISVSQKVEQYTGVAYEVLTASGVLKGEDAKNAAKLMHCVSIVTGAARVYAGDYSGCMSIVSGVSGLTQKPKPSAEMAMMQQMYEVMNKRFDSLEAHLSRIEQKIDSLSITVFRMYKSMMVSFQYTNEKLETLNQKIDWLNIKATALLYQDYQACGTLRDIWKKENILFNRYSDIQKNYNPTCQRCLMGLDDILINKYQLSYFFVSANPMLKSESFIQTEIEDVYKPARELFKMFYNKEMNKGLNALMFPVEYTSDANKPLFILNSIDDLKYIEPNYALEQYFSYEMINEVTDLMMAFHPFFEVSGNSSTYEPFTLENYLVNNQQNKVNKALTEARFKKLLDVTQYAILQQTLISGNLMLDPVYSTLFNDCKSDAQISLAVKVLKNNKVLATNFATYLVNKNISLKDTAKLKELFEKAPTDNDKLKKLNELILINDFKIIGENGKLYLSFKRQDESLKLPCSDFRVLLSNKMMYSDAVFSLLESREKINSQLIDLNFTSNIDADKTVSDKFKYLYTPSQN